MSLSSVASVLRTYFAVLYVIVFLLITVFWSYSETETLKEQVFLLAATAGYAALYLMLPVLITTIVYYLFRIFKKDKKTYSTVLYLTAWFLATILVLCLYGDLRLFELYAYHFNGFVWNLLITPGGVAALGATTETMQTISLEVIFVFLAMAVVLYLVHLLIKNKPALSRRFFVSFISIMLMVLFAEESIYAYSTYTGQEKYLRLGNIIPFHLHSSAKSFLTQMGVEQTSMTQFKVAKGEVAYPLSAVKTTASGASPNIIMLVAESFRWDLLDPEITPNLWALSGKSLKFNKHYSGGNRTRMGMLSMFYGIYAPYWYSFEEQRVAPVLMNVLQQKHYQLALNTSQSFNYPELRHTTFSGISEEFMQELQDGEPWQRDSQNITDIIAHLSQRDKNKAFYQFMFFESTHAPYTFPKQAVIRPDYLQEMNYAKLNLMNNIEAIHNRYINAAHHIDAEVGRLLAYLEQQGLMSNTIVLFTGDHGEEFMEKGHWGHGHSSSFPEEQIHVPLVLHIPGIKPQVIEQRTSHIQIPQTLLSQLGVSGKQHDYSLAGDLFTPLPYLVAGNYNYMAVFDEHYKIAFPFTGRDYFHYDIYDHDDQRIERSRQKQVLAQYEDQLSSVISDSRRFIK